MFQPQPNGCFRKKRGAENYLGGKPTQTFPTAQRLYQTPITCAVRDSVQPKFALSRDQPSVGRFHELACPSRCSKSRRLPVRIQPRNTATFKPHPRVFFKCLMHF